MQTGVKNGGVIRALVLACGLSLGLAQTAAAQSASPPPSQTSPFVFDSGMVSVPGAYTPGVGEVVLASVEVSFPGAPWMRLGFDPATILSGDPASENATRIRITALADGQVQTLNAEHLGFWANTSAIFNGDTVIVELVGFPGSAPSRLKIDSVTFGEPPVTERSICGTVDDRVLSTDNRQGRLNGGCTAWMFNDLNNMFLTAGHCGAASGQLVSFNVPLSNANGSLNASAVVDQFAIEGTSLRANSSPTTLGNDWTYFGTLPNSQTGLTAAQTYGAWYTLAPASNTLNTSHVVRITGFGSTNGTGAPLTWNQVNTTHTGGYAFRGALSSFTGGVTGRTLGYTPDTTGGNSGSAVFNTTTGLVIGIHTNAGCTSSGGYNQGCAIENSALQAALAAPAGINGSGRGVVTGTPRIYGIGDLANNFGAFDTADGEWDKIARPALPSPQGLAWDWSNRVFYAVDVTPSTNARRLWTITPDGVATLLGAITGASGVINGLAYDPTADRLYGIVGSTGMLVSINVSTRVATTIGTAPGGGTFGGLDFDPINGVLYSLNDLNAGAGTRLETINTTTGARTIVGLLGGGVIDANGLAYSARDNRLYTLNAANEQTLRVDPATGVATVLGGSLGLFGSGYGMASLDNCPADTDGDGVSDLSDFFGFLNDFDTNDPAADVNFDGTIDLADFFFFLNWFDTGC